MVTLLALNIKNIYIALAIDFSIIISFLCWKTMTLSEYKKDLIKSSIKIALFSLLISIFWIIHDGKYTTTLEELDLMYVGAIALTEFLVIHTGLVMAHEDKLTERFFNFYHN